jgi:hypothetical protein
MKPMRIARSGRQAVVQPCCPSCQAVIAAEAERCPSCGFTGADTMILFPEPAPPLLPVLDAAGLWNVADLHRIDVARAKLGRMFPQLQWRVCSVLLPEGAKLPVFGFWMLNVCPLYAQETAAQRAWSVLLLIDAQSGQAAVVPGYAAEPWLADDDWRQALAAMAPAWAAGHSAEAVVRFFHAVARPLAASWKRRGLRRKSRSRS